MYVFLDQSLDKDVLILKFTSKERLIIRHKMKVFFFLFLSWAINHSFDQSLKINLNLHVVSAHHISWLSTDHSRQLAASFKRFRYSLLLIEEQDESRGEKCSECCDKSAMHGGSSI